MDRDRPCKTERILLENALNFSLHLLGLLIDDIPAVLPLERLHSDLLIIVRALDKDVFLKEIRHNSDLAIEISMLRRRIILHEHHLRSDLQFQTSFRRI